MKRCFVALQIAETTRDALAVLQEDLRALPRSAARRLRPVKRDNLHLTLQFLGPTPDAQVPAIAEVLQQVARTSMRPGGRVAGVGAFPTFERPRALFGAIGDGRDAIVELTAAVERALVPLGFPAETRPRVPHVTIARVEGARGNGPISDWLHQVEPNDYGPLDDNAIVLFESVLDPGGSVYTPLHALPLAAP